MWSFDEALRDEAALGDGPEDPGRCAPGNPPAVTGNRGGGCKRGAGERELHPRVAGYSLSGRKEQEAEETPHGAVSKEQGAGITPSGGPDTRYPGAKRKRRRKPRREL